MRLKELVMGTALIAAMATGFLLKLTRPSSVVAEIVQAQKEETKIAMAIVGGCAAAGMAAENEEIVTAVLMSQGQICLKISGQEINKAINGKSICSKTDEKCLFTVGYMQIVFADKEPASPEEVAKVQQDVDAAFDKVKAATNK